MFSPYRGGGHLTQEGCLRTGDLLGEVSIHLKRDRGVDAR